MPPEATGLALLDEAIAMGVRVALKDPDGKLLADVLGEGNHSQDYQRMTLVFAIGVLESWENRERQGREPKLMVLHAERAKRLPSSVGAIDYVI